MFEGHRTYALTRSPLFLFFAPRERAKGREEGMSPNASSVVLQQSKRKTEGEELLLLHHRHHPTRSVSGVPLDFCGTGMAAVLLRSIFAVP